MTNNTKLATLVLAGGLVFGGQSLAQAQNLSFDNALVVQSTRPHIEVIDTLNKIGYNGGVVCVVDPHKIYSGAIIGLTGLNTRTNRHEETGLCARLPLKEGEITGLNGINVSTGAYEIGECRYSQLPADAELRDLATLVKDDDFQYRCDVKLPQR